MYHFTANEIFDFVDMLAWYLNHQSKLPIHSWEYYVSMLFIPGKKSAFWQLVVVVRAPQKKNDTKPQKITQDCKTDSKSKKKGMTQKMSRYSDSCSV